MKNKMKSNSGASKRFKVSGNTDLYRKRSGHQHKLHTKSTGSLGLYKNNVLVHRSDKNKVERLLLI